MGRKSVLVEKMVDKAQEVGTSSRWPTENKDKVMAHRT